MKSRRRQHIRPLLKNSGAASHIRAKPLGLESMHIDSHGNRYLTLLFGENSANPLKVDFYRVGTPDGELFMCLITDEKSFDAVMVAKETLGAILEDGWKTDVISPA